jgi:uncharacterized HhH-GPD family protein
MDGGVLYGTQIVWLRYVDGGTPWVLGAAGEVGVGRVFVSHASGDDCVAQELHRVLVEAGHQVFLDIDRRDGVRVGEDWEQRLYAELRGADAVVCVVSSSYVASNWCAIEVAVAKALGTRLIPLSVQPGVRHPLLGELQHLDHAADQAGAFAAVDESLRGLAVHGGWPDGRNPFPGLRAFDADWRRVFFGRERDITALAALLAAVSPGKTGPTTCQACPTRTVALPPDNTPKTCSIGRTAGVASGPTCGDGAGAGTMGAMTLSLPIDPKANELLQRSPLALLIGMVLDQQITMEHAFSSPYELQQRLGHELDARELAEFAPDAFTEIFSRRPALHRFPKANAKRVQEICRMLVERYDGDASRLWTEAKTGQELFRRVSELPGFGRQKAQIFVALLGKRFGVTPKGWREAAGMFGEEGAHYSVADITDENSLLRVRTHKQEVKAAAKEGKA